MEGKDAKGGGGQVCVWGGGVDVSNTHPRVQLGLVWVRMGQGGVGKEVYTPNVDLETSQGL